MRTAVMRLCVGFETSKQSKPLSVAKTIQTEIEGFKKNLPVIRALCSEGLKERHIAKIANILGLVEMDGQETLGKFISLSAIEFKD